MAEVDESELSAEELLRFGPVVEAEVWTPCWIQESRAPLAVAAGRPKLGRVFNDEGVGRAVIIRPCVSRGKRIRGLPPIYTPAMLEANAAVFQGWPMFLDHTPAAVQEALAKRGRSVKELGGQVLGPWWQRDFSQEDDGQYGYQRGGVLAEVWATPFVRQMVSENANLLHTSINAWPTSGKPGPVPWNAKVKGMAIEGIRRQPQGSVDYVVRGGAGGRLLAESADEGEWPEAGWTEEAERFVVSLAESFYSSPTVKPAKLEECKNAEELKVFLAENAPHLSQVIESAAPPAPTPPTPPAPTTPPAAGAGLTEEDVQRLLAEERTRNEQALTEREEELREESERLIEQRETQRELSKVACDLIESAENVPASWKADLKARYSMRPSGPPATLLVEAEVEDGVEKRSAEEVLTERVNADLDHSRDLIAEATGKPRVTGEGGRKPEPGDKSLKERKAEVPYWRERFVGMGLAESEEKAVGIFGDLAETEDEADKTKAAA